MLPRVLCFLVVSAVCAQDKRLLIDRPGNLLQARDPAPRPPFHFIQEDREGTAPKVLVRDARGAVWSVKFGHEVNAEVFATRFVDAMGYFSDVTHYVSSGRILVARGLKRAAKHIDTEGGFRNARFEYRNPSLRFLKNGAWTWKENPFVDTREFNGLKILVMLLSNWDNKDASNPTSNTGIMEQQRAGRREQIYFVTDWGGSMGRWGNICFRNKWDCEKFAAQSKKFIRKIDKDGEVKFGFSSGNHSGDFKDDITVDDMKWLARRLNLITDAQLREALRESGATPHEADHFTTALRARIQQVNQAASMTPERVAGTSR